MTPAKNIATYDSNMDRHDLPHDWRGWPPGARTDYISITNTRTEIVRLILQHKRIQPYTEPDRNLDNSSRLLKDELAAILVALPHDPNNPYRRQDSL